MIRLFLFTLSAAFYFIGISVCNADYMPMDNMAPGNPRMQAVGQELDKIEASRDRRQVVPASGIVPKNTELEFSSELYWAKYDEPKIFSQKGFMSGYNARYAHRLSTDPNSIINMIGLQAQWASGKFKEPAYEGPSGIKDLTYDLRGVIGKDLYPTSKLRTTGYLGYGFRYLKDDSEGLDSDIDGFTLLGYKRYSHYNYLPFGVDIAYQLDPFYSLESNLEYDYMFYGWQVSKLGVVPGYSTLIVDQRYGSGLRASIRLNLNAKNFTAFAEWFYRYWNINQSKSKPDPTDPTFSLFEPKNNTQEFGLRLGVQI
jgi:hypothetical protein